jgi:3-methyladenine DNA glycosylase AlkD
MRGCVRPRLAMKSLDDSKEKSTASEFIVSDSDEILRRIEVGIQNAPRNTPGIRAVRKRISREIAGMDRETVLVVAHKLIRAGFFGRFVAYELVQQHAATMECITLSEVESLGKGMVEWGDVDTFSLFVAGPAWRTQRISDAVIRRWAKSDDRWWRRAALVSTVALNSAARGGVGDGPRTLAICKMLKRDRDPMVVKALSWALRALVARQPKLVRQFVSTNREQLAPLVVREVTNKLKTGLKNPRPGSTELT